MSTGDGSACAVRWPAIRWRRSVLIPGLGVTELSMAPALIAEAKAALRAVDLADARAAADAALDAEDADAARQLALALL